MNSMQEAPQSTSTQSKKLNYKLRKFFKFELSFFSNTQHPPTSKQIKWQLCPDCKLLLGFHHHLPFDRGENSQVAFSVLDIN